MRKIILFLGLVLLVAGLIVTLYLKQTTVKIDLMLVSSTAFENQSQIPVEYTCRGKNINPPLAWSDLPPATESLALVLTNPSAPGGVWVHWLLWNIKPDLKELAAQSVPPGAVSGVTSFGVSGYGGPCPSDGQQRYFFKLYALDTKLSLEKGEKQGQLADLMSAMEGHVLAEAELVGLFK